MRRRIDDIKNNAEIQNSEREEAYRNVKKQIDKARKDIAQYEAGITLREELIQSYQQRVEKFEASNAPDDASIAELRNKFKLTSKRYFEVEKEYNDLQDVTKRETQSLNDHIATANKEWVAMNKEYEKLVALSDEKESQIKQCEEKLNEVRIVIIF